MLDTVIWLATSLFVLVTAYNIGYSRGCISTWRKATDQLNAVYEATYGEPPPAARKDLPQ